MNSVKGQWQTPIGNGNGQMSHSGWSGPPAYHRPERSTDEQLARWEAGQGGEHTIPNMRKKRQPSHGSDGPPRHRSASGLRRPHALCGGKGAMNHCLGPKDRRLPFIGLLGPAFLSTSPPI
jgi:hypothetical protein